MNNVNESSPLAKLDVIIEQRLIEPKSGYTDELLADSNKRMKKIGEESAELIVACVQGDKESVAGEAADLFYHILVAIRGVGVTFNDVENILKQRNKSK